MSPNTVPVIWPDAIRQAAFFTWLHSLQSLHQFELSSLRPASSDASFRRYFRLDSPTGPHIVMDAPPALEDCRPFVQIAQLLHTHGLNVPQVLAWDEANGFMLLSDLGASTYLSHLSDANAHGLYRDALRALVQLQGIAAQSQVPAYDRTLLERELQLFPQWYVAQHLGVILSVEESDQLAQCFELIVQNNLAQPQVLVHRDFHSRNLMVCGGPANPGILDFQDAVWGPITYDVASLLRDAYVELTEDVQLDLGVRYWEMARAAQLPVNADFGLFWRDLEWMGLQRHLKVLGIFARLSQRDGKHGYLDDLPLVWRYAHRAASRYQGLGPLALLLERLAGAQRIEGFC
jgi:N-acetylmuramate 1-kinase